MFKKLVEVFGGLENVYPYFNDLFVSADFEEKVSDLLISYLLEKGTKQIETHFIIMF